MTYAFIQDVPIGPAVYKQIRTELGEQPPRGLVVHLVIRSDKGLRYVDVWESEQDWERFAEERLHKAVWGVLDRAGVPRPEVEPQLQEIEVEDVWVPQGER